VVGEGARDVNTVRLRELGDDVTLRETIGRRRPDDEARRPRLLPRNEPRSRRAMRELVRLNPLHGQPKASVDFI
jgi:hypothetical protein